MAKDVSRGIHERIQRQLKELGMKPDYAVIARELGVSKRTAYRLMTQKNKGVSFRAEYIVYLAAYLKVCPCWLLGIHEHQEEHHVQKRDTHLLKRVS
jgi:hypothetical protein